MTLNSVVSLTLGLGNFRRSQGCFNVPLAQVTVVHVRDGGLHAFFYKNILYNNIEGENRSKIKNILQICTGSAFILDMKICMTVQQIWLEVQFLYYHDELASVLIIYKNIKADNTLSGYSHAKNVWGWYLMNEWIVALLARLIYKVLPKLYYINK